MGVAEDRLVRAIRRIQLEQAGISTGTPEATAWIGTGKHKPLARDLARHGDSGKEGPCSVYRCYDEDGRLLYVGITSQGMARASSHHAYSRWWKLMVRQDWEHYDSRPEALLREAELIATQFPIFNVVRPRYEGS